jgi:hypothetical protein
MGGHSVADNGHIGEDAEVDAGDAEEARLMDTAYGMEAVEEDARDVWDAQLAVGEPNNGEVDAEAGE